MEEALAGAALIVIAAAFVSYGYSQMQHGQAKGLLGWLQSQAIDTAKAAVWITEQIVPLSSYLLHELGKAFNVTYQAAARWVGGLENYITMKSTAYTSLAVAIDNWGAWLVNKKIPSMLKALPNVASHGVTTIIKRLQPIERIIYRVPKLTKAAVAAAVAGALPGVISVDLPYLDWLKKHLKALERVLAGAAGAVIGTAIPKASDLVGIRKRIGKLERTIAATAVAGAVAVAIARLGGSWVLCRNWKRLGRGVCGLPSSAITSLLGLITDLFILADVCRVVVLLEDALKAVEPELAAFIGDVGGALCHGDFNAPPALTGPAVFTWDASQIAA